MCVQFLTGWTPLEIKALCITYTLCKAERVNIGILEVQMIYGNVLISILKNRLRRFLSLTGWTILKLVRTFFAAAGDERMPIS